MTAISRGPSLAVRAVTDRIGDVRYVGVPSEVGQPIVTRLAVLVAAFLTGRAGTPERFQHQSMHGSLLHDVVPAEVDDQSASATSVLPDLGQDPALVPSRPSGLAWHCPIQATNSTMVADFVGTYIPGDRSPRFHRRARLNHVSTPYQSGHDPGPVTAGSGVLVSYQLIQGAL